MTLAPLLLVLFPLLGVILAFIFKRYHMFAILSSAVNLLLSLFLLPAMLAGKVLESFYEFSIFHVGIYFKLDLLSYIFVVVVSLVWLLATIYSLNYIKKDEKSNRYYGFLMLTFSAMMGVFVTGDLLSLFLFFELMTIASYVLVVHNEDRKARYGGSYYLFMGIFGGLLILWGIIFLYDFTGSIVIESALMQLQSLSFLKYFIAGLLIVGFGVKAGMFPVHIWLPKAHPVAPAPASALLSGIIIKAGAYGILRVITVLYWPLTGHHNSITLENIGFITIIIGSITMFLGVINALLQKNIKRMLAYHSVSQMGYILVGIGVAGYIGTHGSLGFTGALYHIINHALFKSNLFLIAGIIYLVTGKINLKYLGGLGRKYPVLTITFLISALGISGVPGFNGYISKTLLHHSLSEAMHLKGNSWIWIAEKIFIITSAGTFCSFLKLGYYIFLRKAPEELDLNNLKSISTSSKIIISTFSVIIISLGLFPHLIIETLFLPLYSGYGFHTEVVTHISFWNGHNLLATASYLLGGGLFFVIALKRSWFSHHFLQYLEIEELVKKVIRYITIKSHRFVNRLDHFGAKGQIISNAVYKALVQIDRNPKGDRTSLTIQSIDFSKLIIALILVVILLTFTFV